MGVRNGVMYVVACRGSEADQFLQHYNMVLAVDKKKRQ